MNLRNIVKTIFFTEIIKGMALTLKSMIHGSVTRQYPLEPRESKPGFRGLHALVKYAETGEVKCIACGLCVAMCPSQCISIQTGEGEGHHKKLLDYKVDVLKCLFCGLCVEACPVGAVVLTEHYAYSNYSRKDFIMDKERLLSNWDRFMSGGKGEAYLEKFWRPKNEDFESYEGQAVFGRGPRRAE